LLIQFERLQPVARQVAIRRKDARESNEGAGLTQFMNEPDAREKFRNFRFIIAELCALDKKFALRADLAIANRLLFRTAEIFLVTRRA
jgi:hypothetical protein